MNNVHPTIAKSISAFFPVVTEKPDVMPLLDENGFEILAGYTKEYYWPDEDEKAHGKESGWVVTLHSIEIVIVGKGIPLLPAMDERQKEFIKTQILDNL